MVSHWTQTAVSQVKVLVLLYLAHQPCAPPFVDSADAEIYMIGQYRPTDILVRLCLRL